MNPKLRTTWYIILAVCEISVFTLIRENSIVGAGFDGGLGALIALGIIRFIAKRKGIPMHIPKEDKEKVGNITMTKITEKNIINRSNEQKSSHAGAWVVGIVVGIIAIIVMLVVWVLPSSSSSISTNTLPATITGTSTDTNGAPLLDSSKTSYQSSFIQSCEGSSGATSPNSAICTCSANYMVTNYSDVQLIAISAKYKLTGKAQELIDAATSCATKSSNATADETTYGNNFMNSCNSNGNLYTQCSCLLTYLRNNYTLAQRVQMDADYNRTKQLPQAVTDAINSCTSSK